MAKKRCPRCWNTDKDCFLCKQNSKEAQAIQREAERERKKFLAELWVKARKYRMKNFNGRIEVFMLYGLSIANAERVKKEVIAEFGPWMGYDGSYMPTPDEIKKLLKNL